MCFFPSNDFSGSFCRLCFGCLCRFGVLHRFGVRFVCHDVYPLYSCLKGGGRPNKTISFGTSHLYATENFFASVFFQKAQKVLRGISRKTFTFGTLHAYTIIPPCNSETISSYSSLFILFTGRSSASLNSTYPEQSDI